RDQDLPGTDRTDPNALAAGARAPRARSAGRGGPTGSVGSGATPRAGAGGARARASVHRILARSGGRIITSIGTPNLTPGHLLPPHEPDRDPAAKSTLE